MGIPKCVKASMAICGGSVGCAVRVVVTRGRALQLPCMLHTALVPKAKLHTIAFQP